MDKMIKMTKKEATEIYKMLKEGLIKLHKFYACKIERSDSDDNKWYWQYDTENGYLLTVVSYNSYVFDYPKTEEINKIVDIANGKESELSIVMHTIDTNFKHARTVGIKCDNMASLVNAIIAMNNIVID